MQFRASRTYLSRAYVVVALFALPMGVACTTSSGDRSTASVESCQTTPTFGFSKPEAQGVSANKLLEMTNWIVQNPVPIFSILISRNGQVIYEMTTSNLGRDEAHYLMSVTKSVTSALVGVELDRASISSTDASVADLLPAKQFPTDADRDRFKALSLKETMGMSALDAPIAPHVDSDDARRRLLDFYRAKDRVKYALTQKILSNHGSEFQYTDVTPAIAGGIVTLKARKTLLELAKETLFDPMGFENVEWMHEDATGFDSASYGLRLRPLDMQKFGNLYLQGGCWGTKRLLSREWVERSFTPWIRSRETNKDPDYGWYWWKDWFELSSAHVANGWKGQRIAIFPAQKVVVTMTGDIGDGSEQRVFAELVNRFILAAVAKGADAKSFDSDMALDLAINRARMQNRIARSIEARMIPSRTAKESHHPLSAEFTGGAISSP